MQMLLVYFSGAAFGMFRNILMQIATPQEMLYPQSLTATECCETKCATNGEQCDTPWDHNPLQVKSNTHDLYWFVFMHVPRLVDVFPVACDGGLEGTCMLCGSVVEANTVLTEKNIFSSPQTAVINCS